MAESFLAQLRKDPAVTGLMGSLGSFAKAKAGDVVGAASDKMEGDTAESGVVKGATNAVSEGKSPVFGGIKGAIKGLFKRGGSAKRPTNIYEQVFIGVPVEQAYENWTEYSKFPEFMKGPESVKVTEEEDPDGEIKQTHQWTAKIFLNRRTWKATVEEDVENRRIRWTTEAAKGTIDGVVTFHPVTDTLTAMIYVLEYRPKGFFEWWGNRWRTVGRRARLDVKHFGRYVMMQDQSQEDSYHEDDDDLEEEDEEHDDVEIEPHDSDDATDNDGQLTDGDDNATEVADDGNSDESEEADAKPKADQDAQSGPAEPKRPKSVRHEPHSPHAPRSARD